ncbi:sigma-54 dependent transcriptional regulator [bacterium]|nr:sigma-54 dependent transcriptional regulator [bacterium]
MKNISAAPLRILVVDDEPHAAKFISELLQADGQQTEMAHDIAGASAALEKGSFDLVLCDMRLDHEEGTELLPAVKRLQPDCLTVFITGYGSVDTAVRAIHEGAFDYISKPLDLIQMETELKTVVARTLKHRETLGAKKGASLDIPINNEDERHMVGRSSAMISVYGALARAALSRENVLITGESGTGKELVATAIHEKGPWAAKPFVTVNCCALSENLLESELFGHVRGAFTGAVQNKRGLFEVANGGTLFLDEIGDISLSLQVKLLRAIQEGEIKPVGSNETVRVDVRVIVATHRDLPQYVLDGKFREDLFYRLKVISIQMPPLRDRVSDIPDLVRYFASRFAAKTGKPLTSVSEEAMDFLTHYSWPGNIRELENAIGRAAAMSRTATLFPEDFPPEIMDGDVSSHSPATIAAAASHASETVISAGESLEELERRHIANTLQSVGFNKSRAADILGIDRVTLYRKAFKYGLISKGGPRKGSASPG